MNHKENRGLIYVIISSIAYGTMPLFTRMAYGTGLNTYMVAMGRFFFGTIIIYLLNKILHKNIQIPKEKIKHIFILSILNTAVPILLYASYHYIDSGLATVLHYTYPLFVILILFFFYKEKINLISAIAIVLCLSGIFLTYTPGGEVNIKGMILAIGSGILWASYMVLLDHSDLREIDTSVLTLYLLTFATVEDFIFSLVIGKFEIISSLPALLSVVILAFVTTVLGFSLFQKGLLLCGSFKTSLFSTLEPVVCIILGVLFLEEVITLKTIIGIIMILSSSMIIIFK